VTKVVYAQQSRCLTHRIEQAKKPFDELTRSIVEALEECPSVHRLGEPPLPNLAEIDQILESLFEIISPGYGRRQHLNLDNASYHIGNHLSEVHNRLTGQVALELYFTSPHEFRRERNSQAEAEDLVKTFLATIPELVRRLEDDLTATFQHDPAAKGLELVLLCYPGISAVRTYRLAHELHRLGLTLIPRMMTEIAHSKTGIDIHPGATIGHRFFIDHGTGTVIGETIRIGDDVTLYQGVTIGARKVPRDQHGNIRHDSPVKRHPTIGNRVVVYANATLVGGDTTIGDDVVIGSSTWIEDSVEPEVIVTNEKPRHRYSKNRLLSKAQPEEVDVPLTEEECLELIRAHLVRIERCDDN
jgi:serine O-acetyltransferase